MTYGACPSADRGRPSRARQARPSYGTVRAPARQRRVRPANRDHLPGATANLGIINVRLALAGRPALTGVLRPGGTPRQFALEPGGTKVLVVDTDSGQVPADKIAQLP